MENTLKFSNSLSVADFKAQHSITGTIDIVLNPKTQKKFFVAGSINGKVSIKGYDNPVISLCTDGTETFYMLHSKATTNVIDTL